MRRALAFLTPIGGAVAPAPSAVPWFPVVGALVGALVTGVWWAAHEVWSPLVAAALAVAADVLLTGALHIDGLADSSDGLLGHLDRGRRLEVMAEPDVGAFGVTVVVVALLLRTSALASLEPTLIVAGLWATSRTVMAATIRLVPYARRGGLVEAFRGGHAAMPIVIGGALAVPLAMVGAGFTGLGAVVMAAIVGTAVVAFAHRRIGGFTGDVLGAAGIVSETVGLLVVAARW